MSARTPRQIRRSAVLRGLLRATKLVDRAKGSLELFAAALLTHGLSDAEVGQVSIDIYEGNMRSYKPEHGLFDWEEKAFEHLPPPPARIFIPGAGMGREAFALADRGYEVWAAEPTEAGYAILRARLGPRALRSAFGDALPEGYPSGFDAVVVGWGSIGHHLGERARSQAFQCLSDLSDGPIIVSLVTPKTQQRAWRAGGRIAKIPMRRGFVRHAGYLEEVARTELMAWSRATGFELHEVRTAHPGVFVFTQA